VPNVARRSSLPRAIRCSSRPAPPSGGVYIKGLGTVSHASIDDNFDRLMERAHTAVGVRGS